MINKACFLDRDGTIIKDTGYLHKIEDISYLPGVFETLKKIQDKGFKIIVVTNQSGISRGYFSEQQMHAVHEKIKKDFKEKEIDIKAFYYSTTHDTKDPLRKPNPGMIHQAQKDFNLSLGFSIIFGDKISDIDAGGAAGLKSAYLIEDESIFWEGLDLNEF